MLKINRCIIFILFTGILHSCKEEVDSSMLWGKTDYYTDFLFNDYDPIKMSKTICFETNEDANGRVGNVKFGIYKKVEDNSYVAVKNEIRLYKNGILCEDNILLVTPEDKKVLLGIEFTPEAEEGMHKWFLKVLDNGGFDRINDYSMEENSLPLLLEWKAEKKNRLSVWRSCSSPCELCQSNVQLIVFPPLPRPAPALPTPLPYTITFYLSY